MPSFESPTPSKSADDSGFEVQSRGTIKVLPTTGKGQPKIAKHTVDDAGQADTQAESEETATAQVVQTPSPSVAHIPFDVQDLPSKGAFYSGITHIHVRRMNMGEVRALAKAITLGSARLTVAAVGRTLSYPAVSLTEGDYEFFLHWHRMNSFKNKASVIAFTCDNRDHVRKVIEGELPESSLEQVDPMPQTVSRETVSLDTVALSDAVTEFYERYGVYPFVSRMEDAVEISEMDEAVAEDIGLYVEYAPYLNPAITAEAIEADPSMASKRVLLRAQWMRDNEDRLDADFINGLEHIKKLMQHGVAHKVSVLCKECQSRGVRMLTVSASTFLP